MRQYGTQVINETCINLIKREHYTETQIRDLVVDFEDTYTVMVLDTTSMLLASTLREQYRLSYWDGFIVACALMSGASQLYSEDMHDGLVVAGQLTIINPFRPASGSEQ